MRFLDTSSTRAARDSLAGQIGRHFRTSARDGLGALLGRQVLEVTPLIELSTTKRGGRSGDSCVLITTGELRISTINRTDPAFTEFCFQQLIDQVGMVQGGLPGRVATLQGNDLFARLQSQSETEPCMVG